MYQVKIMDYDRFTGGVYEERKKFHCFVKAAIYYCFMRLVHNNMEFINDKV